MAVLSYQQLSPRFRNLSKKDGFVGAFILFFALTCLGALYGVHVSDYNPLISSWSPVADSEIQRYRTNHTIPIEIPLAAVRDDERMPRLWIAPINVPSGLGSIMTQVIPFARIAEIFGGTSMFIRSAPTEHTYSITNQFNPSNPVHIHPGAVWCTIPTQWLSDIMYESLIDCHVTQGRPGEVQGRREVLMDRLRIRGCDVVDVKGDMVITNFHLHRCMSGWLRSTNLGSTALEMRKGVLGIHVRWGDLRPGAAFATELNPGRTYTASEINLAVRNLRARATGEGIKRIEIHMEKGPREFFDMLDFEYIRVQAGSDEEDVKMLASAEYKVLSGSDFSVLAAMLAEGGVMVAKESVQDRYFWSSYQHLQYIPFETIEM